MAVTMVTTISRYIGLAADVATLPVTGIYTGSKFTALDTGAKYIFDGAAWVVDLTDIANVQTLSAANDTVTAGYYAGTTLSAVDADLAIGNIKTGVVVFGFTGNYDTEAVVPIAATTVLIGKKGRVNGATITGTMPDNNGDVAAVSSHAAGTSIHVVPAEGYTDGVTDATVITDADFVTGNIRATINIFGIAGKTEVVDTTEGAEGAIAAEIALGKKAWVNGIEITGTHV